MTLPSPAQLASANQSLQQQICDRELAEAQIQKLNEELEARVATRTTELEASMLQVQKNQAALRRSEELFRYTAVDLLECPLLRLFATVTTPQSQPLPDSYRFDRESMTFLNRGKKLE